MQTTEIYKKVSEIIAASEKHYDHTLPAVMRQVLIVDLTTFVKDTQGDSEGDGRKEALAQVKTVILGRFVGNSI